MSEQQGQYTVDQAKYAIVMERLGQQEVRHTEELVNARVQGLLDVQAAQNRVEELERENAELRDQLEARNGTVQENAESASSTKTKKARS